MPKKPTGRKVPMNKKQVQKVRKDATRVRGTEGTGEKGFWALLFGSGKKK
jgi:hypothetical protein